MIYLSFTSVIPDRPLRGPETERYGKITIDLGGKAYQMIGTDNSRALQGEPRPQYLIQDRDTLKVPIHVLLLEKKADSEDIRTGVKPFYLPFEETFLDTLKSIKISVTVLEEYKTSVFVVGSGRQTAFRPCDLISQTVENTLPPLSRNNGYEIRLNIVDRKITLDFLPTLIFLDNPESSEQIPFSKVENIVDSIVADSVMGLDKPISQTDKQSRLDKASRSLELIFAADTSLHHHRTYTFDVLHQKFHKKIHEIQLSSMPTFIIPRFNLVKEVLIVTHLKGIVLKKTKAELYKSDSGVMLSMDNGKAEIQIDSTLLTKDIRYELGLDRFKFKFPNRVIERLKYLEQHCEATVESQADGTYLITFPAHHIELVKKVAHQWESIEQNVGQVSASTLH